MNKLILTHTERQTVRQADQTIKVHSHFREGDILIIWQPQVSERQCKFDKGGNLTVTADHVTRCLIDTDDSLI